MKVNIVIILSLFAFSLNAQILRGVVKDEKGESIIGAHVFWMDKSAETLTNEDGVFELPRKTKETMIHVEFVGYEMAMLTLKPNQNDVSITLNVPKTLKAVEIKGKRGDNMVSALDPRNVERINSNELKKAPCCNLSESFETNGTVDIQYSDAVTGAKEIQMLGLRGIYTQLMVENRPDFYGLAQPYALEYIPGTWIKNIDINKGVGSVRNGFQSITGQINVGLVQPGEDKAAFGNLFAENSGRVEANVHLNKVHTEKFAQSLLLHGSMLQNKLDHDDNGFVDMPLKKQLNGMYRAFYRDDKIESQLFVHAISEERKSGQLIDNPSIKNPFQINVLNQRVSVLGKLGYLGFAKPYNALGSQWSATYHNLNAIYGKNKYTGTQRSLYGNVLFATIINTTDHKLQLGGSAQLDDYKEFLNDKNISRTEGVAGAFGEYVFNRPTMEGYNDWTIVAGLRADYHNIAGFFVTPRLNVKYNFNEGDVVRFVAGRGVRMASPIAENVSYLATNREIVFPTNLKPEDAWNFGLNFVKTMDLGNKKEARLSLDLYRTEFVNQIIVDAETNYQKVQFYNLTGQSYSNTLLAMLTAEVVKGWDVKLAYKYNDVKTTYNGKLDAVPLVPKHRYLMTLDYKTPNKKWSFNYTVSLTGQQRLADRSYTPPQYLHHFDPYSPRYYLMNASVNRFFKTFELYAGGENLTDYTQHNPIIAYNDPTSIYFDATQVYAPMMGRRIYAGLRWWIDRKK
ncbi:MAG: carboxypeptidase-like regulatory domain-containing protein [Saprospiraceae bacterium]|nr:carboxypeptidase-like regulatory domain-containing protein [Saprospiraceae bacterium]